MFLQRLEVPFLLGPPLHYSFILASSYQRILFVVKPCFTIFLQGNGFLYQARTAVSGVVFYGRSSVEDEAVVKCCKKAINHILQTQQQVCYPLSQYPLYLLFVKTDHWFT